MADVRFTAAVAGTPPSMKDEQELEDEARRSRDETEALRTESGLDRAGGEQGDGEDAES